LNERFKKPKDLSIYIDIGTDYWGKSLALVYFCVANYKEKPWSVKLAAFLHLHTQ
jgi:hypothetical protein